MREKVRKGLRLFSFDGGGIRSLSQLEILKAIIHHLREEMYPNEPERELLPCECIDMMGGSDTGGLLVVMFTALRMSVQEATDAFTIICQKVYESDKISASERTSRLKECIEYLLKSKGLPSTLKLTDDVTRIRENSGSTVAGVVDTSSEDILKCLGFVVAKPTVSITSPYILRTYPTRNEPSSNITVVEAVLATCAAQPAFLPVILDTADGKKEYTGGAIGVNNPSREVLSEAYRHFGPDEHAAAFVSIGSGCQGALALATNKGRTTMRSTLATILNATQTIVLLCFLAVVPWWHTFWEAITRSTSPPSTPPSTPLQGYEELKVDIQLRSTVSEPVLYEMFENISKDCDVTARQMHREIGHHPIYLRFTVDQGSPFDRRIQSNQASWIATSTRTYLGQRDVYDNICLCAELLRIRECSVSLEQLNRASRAPLIHRGIPPLATHFIPRPELLRSITSVLDREPSSLSTQRIIVLSGLAGVGKTELAVYTIIAYRFRFDYVFFVNGSSRETIQEDLKLYVRAVSPSFGRLSFEEAKSFFMNPENTSWLLIYDNVDDISIDLRPLLPSCTHGTIIVTTRNRSLGQLASDSAFHLKVDVMTDSEAVELLLRSACIERTDSDDIFASAIGKEVGNLPVALTQAGSYIFEASCGAKDYLEELRLHKHQLMTIPSNDRHHRGAYAAFQLSYECLPARIKSTLQILACFHFAKFPLAAIELAAKSSFQVDHFSVKQRDLFLEDAARFLMEIFHTEGAWSRLAFDKAIISLQNHSLINITTSPPPRLLYMHPLLQEFIRSTIPVERLPLFQSAAARILGCIVKEKSLQHLLPPHVNALPVNSSPSMIAITDRAACASILANEAIYDDARAIWQGIYDLSKQLYGPISLEVAVAALGLAHTYHAEPSAMEAAELEALRIREKLLGVDHTETIRVRSNLSSTYQLQGRYLEAASLREQISDILHKRLGPDNLETLSAMSALSETYESQGRYLEAQRLQEAMLEYCHRELGSDHLKTLLSKHNLANIYHSQGRYSEAKQLQELVLKKRSDLLGELHPSTLRAKHNLARTYYSLGMLLESQKMQEAVYEQRLKHFGEHHPVTLRALHELALTHHAQGKYSKAQQLLEAVFVARCGKLGRSHPATFETMLAISLTYYSQGLYIDAYELQEKVLEYRRTQLGPKYAGTGRAMCYLARSYITFGRMAKAKELVVAADQIYRDNIDINHPWVKDVDYLLEEIAQRQSADASFL